MANTLNGYWEKNKLKSTIKLPRNKLRSRFDLFKRHLKGKRVLHIGCTDHPYTLQEIKSGNLLHSYMESVSKSVHGIDISSEGVSAMKKHGFANVHKLDVNKLSKDPQFLKLKFDVIVISEVVEHLLNPGISLESIRDYIKKTNPSCEVIFTVPNLYNFGVRFFEGLRNVETNHFDHKFYFSYRTFRVLTEECGFKVNFFSYISYFRWPKNPIKSFLLNIYSLCFPCLAPYIYFKCKVK